MSYALLAPMLLAAITVAMPAAELKGVNLGKHISGPKITTADLVGKIVLFEYWGIHCPPCRANIPHISTLAALAKSEQLVVIANQCQEIGSTAKIWLECKGTDKPVVIDDGELPGSNVTSIPRCFLFDHTGKQVYDGGPQNITEAMIIKLLDAAPGPLVSGGPYKACASEAAALWSSDRSVTSVVKSLRVKAANDKAKAGVQSEAKALLESVKTYFDKQLAGITSDKSDDPLSAVRRLNRMLILIKGDEWGKPFEEIQAQIKTDKSFQAEVKAAEVLEQIKAEAAKIGLGSDVTVSKRPQAQTISQSLDQLIKHFATTKAGKEATSLKASWFR